MSNLTLKSLNFNNFSEILLKWNKIQNNRKMPWKGERDPYRIWISEIILQQTRVEQGLAYYQRFIADFPDVHRLAAAPEAAVFKRWEGLGYYSRCRNLMATARLIVDAFQGRFPDSYEGLLQLKGVGPYTAAAIASFAYNLPHAVVDGNVLRVLARVFGIEKPIDSTAGRKYFERQAAALLDRRHPGHYNQAIMDFGATVCKPAAPSCEQCVYQASCIAYQHNRITQLPVKEKKLKQRQRFFYFFVLRRGGKLALRQRTAADIWQQLYEFPVLELPLAGQEEQAVLQAGQLGWISGQRQARVVTGPLQQKLTHQTITAVFIEAPAKRGRVPASLETCAWVDPAELTAFAFPKIIHRYLENAGV
ncbi:A/G-specific adenine glycosylase [Niabella terrae]